jgi:SAM-dependent methyltransferase
MIGKDPPAGTEPGFDHNGFYHRFLLRQVPPECGRALDVGCGSGLFARRLAAHAASVDAIDRAPEMIAQARSQSTGVRFIHADLADHDLERYDYIACVASIHHMPFAETVTRLRAALTPGGVLAVVGCYRQASAADHAPDLIAVPANLIANAALRARSRPAAPTMAPRLTLPEIRRHAARLLPGAVIRRRLFWRYTLIYRRPEAG